MTRLVWRIEDNAGNGVYCSMAACVSALKSDNRPMPYEDGLEVKDHCCFGFRTLQAARAWFDDPHTCRRIDNENFKLNCYAAEEVHHGGRQLLFNKATAKFLGSKPVRSIHGDLD